MTLMMMVVMVEAMVVVTMVMQRLGVMLASVAEGKNFQRRLKLLT